MESAFTYNRGSTVLVVVVVEGKKKVKRLIEKEENRRLEVK